MFLDNFILDKQWQQFIKKYKNAKSSGSTDREVIPHTLIADEDIWPFVISAFFRGTNFPVLVITSTHERAFKLEQEIKCIIPDVEISSFPSIGNSIFYKNKTTPAENLTKRLNVVKNLLFAGNNPKPLLIIATSNSLINLMPVSKINEMKSIEISTGKEYNREKLVSGLIESGYERVSRVYDCGEFSVRGEIIDIFDITGENPVRIDFIGDEVEKIFFYEIKNQEIVEQLNNISIFPDINPWEIKEVNNAGNADLASGYAVRAVSLIDLLNKNIPDFTVLLCDPVEIYLKVKSDIDILKRTFERDRDVLAVDSKTITDFYLVEKDFIEKIDENRKLNIISTSKEAYDISEFNLNKITRQKKSYGSSVDFIRNIKSDLKEHRKVVISLDSKDRRKKIEELLLNNSVSYTYPEINDPVPGADESIKYSMFQSDIVNILDKHLYSGYQSTDVSLYGELDIYEQMQRQISEREIFSDSDLKYFEPGEYVVHKNHGIGRYVDIISKQVDGCKREYFLI